jgi:hypothetical protein
VWRSFFDAKLKASIGLLPDQILQTRESVWKGEGASNGGWSLNDNYERYASLRLEYKPINGLNVGTQVNFLPMGQSPTSNPLADLAESFKEITLAAKYKGNLFNALAGVRFDGADGINKFDTWTYLKDYYGEWGYVGNAIQNDKIGGVLSTLSPHWKHGDDVYGKVTGNFTTANADKPFDGSYRLVFSFNYKAVKNL